MTDGRVEGVDGRRLDVHCAALLNEGRGHHGNDGEVELVGNLLQGRIQRVQARDRPKRDLRQLRTSSLDGLSEATDVHVTNQDPSIGHF